MAAISETAGGMAKGLLATANRVHKEQDLRGGNKHQKDQKGAAPTTALVSKRLAQMHGGQKKTAWHMWASKREKATAPHGGNASAIGTVCGNLVSPPGSAWNSRPYNRRALGPPKNVPPTPGRFLGLTLLPAGSKKGAAWRSHLGTETRILSQFLQRDKTMGGQKMHPLFFLQNSRCGAVPAHACLSQDTAVWQWWNFLHTLLPPGKTILQLNLDEIAVTTYCSPAAGLICKHAPGSGHFRLRPVHQASRAKQRSCLSHFFLVR